MLHVESHASYELSWSFTEPEESAEAATSDAKKSGKGGKKMGNPKVMRK